MPARIVYAGAALLLVVALFGIRSGPRGVVEREIQVAGHLPARLYEPPTTRAERLPVLVLSQGEVGDSSLLGSLARRLTAQDIAVVVFDARGHGYNRLPFERSDAGVGDGALDDFDAVVLWARAQPGYDGQRVAVGGHGTGAAAAFAYAERRDPGVAAVIGISGASELRGPYRPPNVLLMWAGRDASSLRVTLRARGAELIGANRVVVERTYGSFERGSAVRLAEVEGTNHLSILYSAGAVREISAWLEGAVAPAGGTAASDARLAWAALGLLASLVLLWGLPAALAPLVPATGLPEVSRPASTLAVFAIALAGAGLLLSGTSGSRGPLSAYPVSGARDVVALFALAGAALLVWAARDERVHARGLGDPHTWAGAGTVFAAGYVAFGTFASPFWDPLLTPRGVVPWLAASLLLLPWFGTSEWLLRGSPRRQAWLPIAGRLLTLGALVGGAWAGLLPAVTLPALPATAAALAVFEVLAYRTSRVSPNPWLAALPQSLWTAWLLTAFFPYG